MNPFQQSIRHYIALEILQSSALYRGSRINAFSYTLLLHINSTSVLSNATTSICACSFSNFYDRAEISCTAVIDVARRWKRSGKGAAQDSKCRGEVRLHTPRCRGVVRGTGGQAISQLQRQSLSSWEYIDTSGAHWPVYNIAYRNVRAPTFRSSRTSSREKHPSTIISHRSRILNFKKWNY